MPRKAKRTQSGQPAQAVSPVAGQMYGAGVEQARLQAAMPAPNLRSAPGVSSPQATPAVAPTAPAAPSGPSEAERFRAAVQAAQALQGQTGLFREATTKPDEPLTAGLSVGPGPGPEVLGTRFGNPTAATLYRLTQITGDPLFAELARRAGIG